MDLEKARNKYSVKIKQIMQDSPDLSYEFVHQLLIAQAEINAGMIEPFECG